MARGWESKSVESQIELAETRRAASQGAQVDAAAAERNSQRESLLLSRKRVLHDLEKASKPGHRETLQGALDYLDRKLAQLDAAQESSSSPLNKGRPPKAV